MFRAETGLDALARSGGMHAGHRARGDPLAGRDPDAAPGQQLEQVSGGADRAVRPVPARTPSIKVATGQLSNPLARQSAISRPITMALLCDRPILDRICVVEARGQHAGIDGQACGPPPRVKEAAGDRGRFVGSQFHARPSPFPCP